MAGWTTACIRLQRCARWICHDQRPKNDGASPSEGEGGSADVHYRSPPRFPVAAPMGWQVVVHCAKTLLRGRRGLVTCRWRREHVGGKEGWTGGQNAGKRRVICRSMSPGCSLPSLPLYNLGHASPLDIASARVYRALCLLPHRPAVWRRLPWWLYVCVVRMYCTSLCKPFPPRCIVSCALCLLSLQK